MYKAGSLSAHQSLAVGTVSSAMVCATWLYSLMTLQAGGGSYEREHIPAGGTVSRPALQQWTARIQ